MLLSIIFFFMVLLFPSISFEGACNGLVLWFQTVLPTLLPSAILSNLIIKTNRISSVRCYTILIGFLCGYPMGAKTISDLVKVHQISQEEGQYLLSFCNNTSPMFVIGYLILQHFHDTKLILPSLIILFCVPIICSFFFRYKYKFSKSHSTNSFQTRTKVFDFQMLDDAIMNGFETLTRVGGYIILFSILFNFVNFLPPNPLYAFLEITNGISYIMKQPLSYEIKFILTHALTSFGGICSIMQTHAMVQDSGLSIRPYIKEKLITAMVTSFVAYIYILFIGS